MTYHELIDLYKNGTLDEEKKKKVEKDIERQDAISEYLYERDDFDIFSTNENVQGTDARENDEEAAAFTHLVKTTIRKAFIKTGVIVGVVVFVILCFVIFAVPKIVDCFYYNPAKIVGVDEYGNETNQLSLDIATYSELFLPCVYRNDVAVVGKGNAEYDITVHQTTTMTGNFTDVAGTIYKGKMTMYNPNVLNGKVVGLTGNAFAPAEDMLDDAFSGTGVCGTKDEAYKTLKNLKENNNYIAYVTLIHVMQYSEFVEWEQKYNIAPNWCAMCQKNEFRRDDKPEYCNYIENIGFLYCDSVRKLAYDKVKYPLLTYYDVAETSMEEQDWIVSEENMKQHVISMLHYMADQKKFCKMMEEEADYIGIANNVEKYGLNIYGFTVIGDKEEILRVSELEGVDYIYTHTLE